MLILKIGYIHQAFTIAPAKASTLHHNSQVGLRVQLQIGNFYIFLRALGISRGKIRIGKGCEGV